MDQIVRVNKYMNCKNCGNKVQISSYADGITMFLSHLTPHYYCANCDTLNYNSIEIQYIDNEVNDDEKNM